MASTDVAAARTKLLTLLNVASVKPQLDALKRKRGAEDQEQDNEHNTADGLPELRDWRAIADRAKVQDAVTSQSKAAAGIKANGTADSTPLGQVQADDADMPDQDDDSGVEADIYQYHFGAETPLLSADAVAAASTSRWRCLESTVDRGYHRVESRPESSGPVPSLRAKPVIPPALASITGQPSALQKQANDVLEQYQDLWYSDVPFGQGHAQLRRTAGLWAIQHIIKTRNRVVKNNEHLAHQSANHNPSAAAREVRDQGFTRPKVLVLLPFRSSALAWVEAFVSLTSSLFTPKHLDRFRNEFGLPEGAVDKLAEPEAEDRYPEDHRETFKGNLDDTFRLGVKWNRKEIRLYTEIYGSDMVIGSPLGLRTMIEKDGDADFLSSIEVVIADQLDVMLMQNWSHVEFVFDRLNSLPKQTRDADFSRIKPWYLEQRAPFLRQSILLSSLDSPEIRSLYRGLRNVAGKVRFENAALPGVLGDVRSGVKHTWTRFQSLGIESEEEDRWKWLTEQTMPSLRRSAVVSEGGTMIFVPSYLDFLRLQAYFKTLPDFEFAALSEYSSNADISRARTAFFNHRAPLLLLTERFHFYRRYKLRGARTIVFYAPPLHAQFYAELCEYPFLGSSAEGSRTDVPPPEPEEVRVEVIFSRWDEGKVARIVGAEHAPRLVTGDGTRFTFQ